MNQWLTYEPGNSVSMSVDWMWGLIALVVAAVLILATWINPDLRRRVWR